MTVVVDNVGQEEDKENEINLLRERVRETERVGTNERSRVALIGKMPHDNNASSNHSQKNQKMYNRCLRECGGDETAGFLHFRECLAKKKKARREKRKALKQHDVGVARSEVGVECMRGLGSASLLVTALSIPPAEPAPPEDAEWVTLDEWQEFNVGLSRSEASHYEEQFTADASARVRFEGAVAEGAKGGAPTTKRQKRGLTPDGDGMVSVLGAKLHCVRWTVLGAGCEGGIPSKT